MKDLLKKPAADAAPPAPDMIRVRVLVETLGSPRAPIAHRGDILDVTREEFAKLGPGVFEDVEAVAKAKAEAEAPRQDPWFAQMKQAMQADREAAALGLAITAKREGERVAEKAQHFEKLSKG